MYSVDGRFALCNGEESLRMRREFGLLVERVEEVPEIPNRQPRNSKRGVVTSGEIVSNTHDLSSIIHNTMYSAARLLALCASLAIVLPTNALYFYMDGASPKCFFEELPKDTLVVGLSTNNPIAAPLES